MCKNIVFNLTFMQKLSLMLFIFILFVEVGYSQNYLGKNKVDVKKEFFKKQGNGRVSDIKSFGYAGYLYSSFPKSSDIIFAIFNNKGICFLECMVTHDKNFIDNILSYYSNQDNYKVYQINPNVSKEHEFVDEKTSVELVVESNNPMMINATYNLFMFKSAHKQDVVNYFDKKYAKEYLNIKEKELKEKQRQELINKEVIEIESVLTEISIKNKLESIKSNITNFYRQKTKDIITSIPIKQLLSEEATNKEVTLDYDFTLMIDKDKKVSIIKDKRIYNFPYYNYDVENPLGEYKERKINPLMLSLKEECRNGHFIDGYTYYKAGNIIFLDNCGLHQNFNFETDIIGVKVKKDELKYFSHENRISKFEEVHDWCSKNIIGKGFHYIHYIIIDSKLYCKEINPNKDELEYLKRYLK